MSSADQPEPTCPVCQEAVRLEGRRLHCSGCGVDLRVLDSGVMASCADPGRIEYPESGNALCLAVEESSFWFQHRNRVIAAAPSSPHPTLGHFNFIRAKYTHLPLGGTSQNQNLTLHRSFFVIRNVCT